jgi:hypothetical protein
MRIKKFATEIFLLQAAPGSCCIAKQFTLLCGGPWPKQREIKRFAVAGSTAKADLGSNGALPASNKELVRSAP